jgi:hypothetical protein
MVNDLHPDQIDLAYAPTAREAITGVELDGESVLYDESTQAMHVLNPTATVVWACCDGSATVDELVGELAEAYGVERSVLEHDVLELVRQFGHQGLLAGVTPVEQAPDVD